MTFWLSSPYCGGFQISLQNFFHPYPKAYRYISRKNLISQFTARYSDNPPYNPGFSDPSDYYGGYSGPETAHAPLSHSITGYPTGTVPPPHSHVPLLHQAPPRSVHVWTMRSGGLDFNPQVGKIDLGCGTLVLVLYRVSFWTMCNVHGCWVAHSITLWDWVYNIWVKIENKLPIQLLTQFDLVSCFPSYNEVVSRQRKWTEHGNTKNKPFFCAEKRPNNRGFYNTHFLDQEILLRKKPLGWLKMLCIPLQVWNFPFSCLMLPDIVQKKLLKQV